MPRRSMVQDYVRQNFRGQYANQPQEPAAALEGMEPGAPVEPPTLYQLARMAARRLVDSGVVKREREV